MSIWHVSTTTSSGCVHNRTLTVICTILISISICLWFYRRKENDSKPHGSNLLIIDGCNGPLKLNKISLLDESSENNSFRNKCISLLRIQGGEVKSEFMFLLQKNILKLLFDNRHLALDSVKIFFDGRGTKEIQNRSWQNFDSNKNNTVQVIITHQNDEADDVIVRLVQQRIQHSQPSKIHSSLLDDVKSYSKVHHDDACILTLIRNQEGSGKSRRLLKPYCLVRPGSIYSLPFMTPELSRQSLHDLHKLLHSNSKLFQNYVQRRIINKNDETIVVTDDVFLRQRILEAGGVVLTFEQLWSLLS